MRAGEEMLVPEHQNCRQSWRWRGGRATTSAVLGLALLVFSGVMFLRFTSPSQDGALNSSDPVLVDLTLVKNAKEKGALCLDGTLPGYHFLKGFDSGADNWLIHLEGGGWCHDLESCNARKYTVYGSSSRMERQVPFTGILSNLPSYNPDFFNWNKVKIRYCDGASFSGDVEETEQNGTTLYFRGERIWKAVMEELLLNGLATAKKALLTGCSAGGLATYIHCDDFKALLPNAETVKCMADGGFFLDVKDISGKSSMHDFYSDVVHLQDVGKMFPNCISRMDAAKCFFPEEITKSISTPVFILNSAYDAWQVKNVLAPGYSDPSNLWASCKLDIKKCNPIQIKILEGFRAALLDDISDVKTKKDWGIFVDSCFVHCQSLRNITWHSPYYQRINNKTIAESTGDWYFDRREVKEIDGPYPCNPTCVNDGF
ncbi:pectin acetylesterase 5-like protein [Carex littledalei]|uniref:Pectin acetylesterase n=1 Tax=Carex littledalei TaxID=544730 RepID=A0A833R635_9POAL|nr:pectin acetylesterase 5-like protein [Carex littledalei]